MPKPLQAYARIGKWSSIFLLARPLILKNRSLHVEFLFENRRGSALDGIYKAGYVVLNVWLARVCNLRSASLAAKKLIGTIRLAHEGHGRKGSIFTIACKNVREIP